MRGEIIKKFLTFFVVLLVVIYFGVGWFAYGQAASVPCEVWYEEANNTPSNWSLGTKADWDPSDYFIDGYEEVTIFIPTRNITGPHPSIFNCFITNQLLCHFCVS